MTHYVVQQARMVLVVDIFETIRTLARKFLEAASFIVRFAGNGL